jgi:hypothetical protein
MSVDQEFAIMTREALSLDIGAELETLEQGVLYPDAFQHQGHLVKIYGELKDALGFGRSGSDAMDPQYLAAYTPVILGGSELREFPYKPGLPRHEYSIDDHLRGLTDLITRSPKIGVPQKTELALSLVKIASQTQEAPSEKEEFLIPTRARATTPSLARRAVLGQIRATIVREEFRQRSGQQHSDVSLSELQQVEHQLVKTWRFTADRAAKAMAAVMGLAGIAVLANKRTK